MLRRVRGAIVVVAVVCASLVGACTPPEQADDEALETTQSKGVVDTLDTLGRDTTRVPPPR